MYTIKFVLTCGILGAVFTSICISIAQMTLLMRACTHKQHSTLFETHQAHIDHLYTNTTPVSPQDTVLYAIVTPDSVRDNANTENERQKLTEASLKTWPVLQRFNASYQLDASCLSILRRTNITISTNYYSEERGAGWIHAGKVGHWCSFLRYMDYCHTSNAVVCVWIEDDFKLSARNIHKIESQALKIAQTHDNTYAVTSLGLGDEVNIIDSRLIRLLFDRFHNFEIRKPLDITLRTTHLGKVNRVFDQHDRIFVGKETSTLVCPRCKLLSVQTVNQQIRANPSKFLHS